MSLYATRSSERTRHGHRHRHRLSRALGQRKRRCADAQGAADHRQQRPHRRSLHAGRPCRLRPRNGPRLSRAIPLHARRSCFHVSLPALDHAPVRRLRQRPSKPTNASSSSSAKAKPGSRTAFDLPTLMGLDSDDPRSLGEVGRLGVAVDSLDDMEVLFDGIDLEDVSVSMTINAPAIIVMAYYLANAKRARGRLEAPARHHSKRHPQGVSRSERNRLSAGAVGSARVRS